VAEKLSGKTVHHRTDNIDMENILKVGRYPDIFAALDMCYLSFVTWLAACERLYCLQEDMAVYLACMQYGCL